MGEAVLWMAALTPFESGSVCISFQSGQPRQRFQSGKPSATTPPPWRSWPCLLLPQLCLFSSWSLCLRLCRLNSIPFRPSLPVVSSSTENALLTSLEAGDDRTQLGDAE